MDKFRIVRGASNCLVKKQLADVQSTYCSLNFCVSGCMVRLKGIFGWNVFGEVRNSPDFPYNQRKSQREKSV